MIEDIAVQFVSSSQTLSQRITEVAKPTEPDGLILKAWAQSYIVRSIIILVCITVSNMRRGILLCKLILLEETCGPREETARTELRSDPQNLIETFL